MNIGFTEHNINNVVFLTIPSFDKTKLTNHCFSTRLGGVSEGIFATMNLGLTRGDDIDKVKRNFDIISSAIGVKTSSLVLTKQIHSDNIIRITKTDCTRGFSTDGFDNADGFITNDAGVTLTAVFADCVPIFLLDPIKKAIGIVHSGWRGTVLKISQRAINAMREEFGSRPGDIMAAIGPSIGPCHYEVSGEVALSIAESCGKKDVVKPLGNGKYMLDLWDANAEILKNSSILEDNITSANICTFCNNEKYFSHRFTEGKRGNLAAMIALRSD